MNLKQTIQVFLLVLINSYCNCFEFHSPFVNCASYQINVITTCDITLTRGMYLSIVSSTDWNISEVPGGANITVIFPKEYTLYGDEACDLLRINNSQTSSTDITVTSSNLVINTGSNTISIINVIPQSIYIYSVLITISKVHNPSPASPISPFGGTIGNDFANIIQTGEQLTPGNFLSCDITFKQTTVNTTGNMVISVQLGDQVPVNGQIRVTLPTKWTRELSATHLLNIANVMSCTALTSNINSGLTCSGFDTTVIIDGIFNSALENGTKISFSINNLFSPPTTQTNIDSITIESLNGSYLIDQITAYVSGLTAKDLPIFLIPNNNSMIIINDRVSFAFTFNLIDTIDSKDYFVIEAQSGAFINNMCQGTIIKIPSTCVAGTSRTMNPMNITQTTTNVQYYSGINVGINILSFVAPPSAHTNLKITISIMQYSGLKMVGSTYIDIQPKQYSAVQSTANTMINSVTSYSISFMLEDSLLSSGYIVVYLPNQLTVNSISVEISASSLKTNPSITKTADNSSITIKNINISSSNILSQNVTITITGLGQPSSVQSISDFILFIYYSSADDLVAKANAHTMSSTPGYLLSASVTSSNNQTANTGTTYEFTIVLGNRLNASSTIQVMMPASVNALPGGTCQVQLSTTSCSISGQTLNIALLTTSYSSQVSIKFSYTNFINPPSTRPTSSFTFTTLNQHSQIVDVLPSNLSVTLTMTTLSSLLSTLKRDSLQNSEITTYTIDFIQSQLFEESSAVAVFQFPPEVSIVGPVNCNSGIDNLNCQVASGNIVNVFFTPSNDSKYYQFSISGIANPDSFQPISSIQVTTMSPDFLYQYSTIKSGLEIINQVPSKFSSLDYQFTGQVLNSATTLNLQVKSLVISNYLILTFANSFRINESAFSCISPNFNVIKSLSSSSGTYSLTIQSSASQLPSQFNLTITGLISPATIPKDFSNLTSYTANNYIISQNNQILFTTYCIFPCNTCNNSQRSACTSCYTNPSISNSPYLYNYSCVETCPPGYYNYPLDFVCQQCSSPCLECSANSSNCTNCNIGAIYKYLNISNNKNTCLSSCPQYMYPDTTGIPYICTNCISPCSQCLSLNQCLSCVDGLYFHRSKYECVSSCPDGTAEIGPNCIDCTSHCATCFQTTSNCTSCTDEYGLFGYACKSPCPSDMTNVENICIFCDQNCLTCSPLPESCTSCNSTGSTPFLFNALCMEKCPQYCYSDSFNKCILCSSLNIGCSKNCSSPTVCLSCDEGYVHLNSKCLSTVPDGYLNISGEAIPCEDDCATCQVSLTNCTSCKTLNLYGNTCNQTCPLGYVGVKKQCTPCTYPCSQCINSTILCLKCASNSSLYLSSLVFRCVSAQNCSVGTYPDNSTNQCLKCPDQCSSCTSPLICVTCVQGFFFINQTFSCNKFCPPQSVGMYRICYACVSPCYDCQVQTKNCSSCIEYYYYNSYTHQCLTSCPNDTIQNSTSMKCLSCQSPCNTCINTTDTCLSCNNGTFLTNNLCEITCPAGQFGQSRLCKPCQHNCETCSSATSCLSCTSQLKLSLNQCVDECPDSLAYITNNNVCTNCSTIVNYCINCSEYGQCYNCIFPKIFYQGSCFNQCKYGQIFNNSKCQSDNSTKVLQKSLSSSSPFPIPFTIFGCVIFIACSTSKLQNANTYLIGILYSLVGLLETGSLVFLIYCYASFEKDFYLWSNFIILLVVAGLILFLNFLAMLIQSPYLLSDNRFTHWFRSKNNKCFFIFVSIFSTIVNYKFRMIFFTKLFRFICVSAMLDSVHKFRIFYIFSFFGILVESVGLYVSIISIVKRPKQTTTFYAFLDVIIIFVTNIILAFIIVLKSDNFFEQQTAQGYLINKKISNIAQDYSKEAILVENEQNDSGCSHLDSNAIIKREKTNVNHIIQQVVEEKSNNDEATGTQNRFEETKGQSNITLLSNKRKQSLPFASGGEGVESGSEKKRFTNRRKQGNSSRKQGNYQNKNLFSIPSELNEENRQGGGWNYSQPQGYQSANRSNIARVNLGTAYKKPYNQKKNNPTHAKNQQQKKKQNQQMQEENISVKNKTDQSFVSDKQRNKNQLTKQDKLNEQSPQQIINSDNQMSAVVANADNNINDNQQTQITHQSSKKTNGKKLSQKQSKQKSVKLTNNQSKSKKSPQNDNNNKDDKKEEESIQQKSRNEKVTEYTNAKAEKNNEKDNNLKVIRNEEKNSNLGTDRNKQKGINGQPGRSNSQDNNLKTGRNNEKDNNVQSGRSHQNDGNTKNEKEDRIKYAVGEGNDGTNTNKDQKIGEQTTNNNKKLLKKNKYKKQKQNPKNNKTSKILNLSEQKRDQNGSLSNEQQEYDQKNKNNNKLNVEQTNNYQQGKKNQSNNGKSRLNIEQDNTNSQFESIDKSSNMDSEPINDRPCTAHRKPGSPQTTNNESLQQLLVRTQNKRNEKTEFQEISEQEEKIFTNSKTHSKELLNQGQPSRKLNFEKNRTKKSNFVPQSSPIQQQDKQLPKKLMSSRHPWSMGKNKQKQGKKDQSNSKQKIQNNRSKSISYAPLLKFTNKNTNQNIDSQIDDELPVFNKNYEEEMIYNNRYKKNDKMQNIKSLQGQKSINLSSVRNLHQTDHNQMKEFEDEGNNANTEENQQIKQYYRKYKNKGNQKRKRKKKPQKQLSIQEVFKLKQLQRIYLKPENY